MRQIFALHFIFYCSIQGHSQISQNQLAVFPEHFNVEIPFDISKVGITLNTYWGFSKIFHKTLLDNHSPTWANEKIIKNNKSIKLSNDFKYRTTVADGSLIQGDVFICDNVFIESVLFKNVIFYEINSNNDSAKQQITNGTIGSDLMEKGIWKIDFKTKKITFASSLDSLKDMEDAILLPSQFVGPDIKIDITFRSGLTKSFELDLGYNGGLIMPKAEFGKLAGTNERSYTDIRRFSTPSSSSMIENIHTLDSIQINKVKYIEGMVANDLVKEFLLGRRYFERFDFIVLDYIDKKVFISKNKKY